MISFSLIAPIALALLLPFFAAASYEAATEAFKKGDLAAAKAGLLAVDTSAAQNPSVLFNLGLIAQKEKRLGAAIGLWRKGILSAPSDDDFYSAIAAAQKLLPRQEIARDFTAWEIWRSDVLQRLSPLLLAITSALLLAIGGWLLIRWLGRRRRTLEDDLALPPFPMAGAVFALLFAFLLVVLVTLYIDRLEVRGTVLNSKVAVRSAPDPDATSLFEIFEGMEVVRRETRVIGSETWCQIEFPGGLGGWVPAAEIFATDDMNSAAFTSEAAK